MRHDLIVLGAGPTGCAAAEEAVRCGLDVLLVDRCGDPRFGLQSGTAPTHAFPAMALQIHASWHRFGIPNQRGQGDRGFFRMLASTQRTIIQGYVGNFHRQLLDSGVSLEVASVRFESPRAVRLGQHDVREAPVILIATGTRPRRPNYLPFDDRVICDGDTILTSEQEIRNIIVVGAEDLGCEFSCLFALLGANVTLVDRRNHLLRHADRDVLSILEARMWRMGITVALEEEIDHVALEPTEGESNAVVSFSSGRIEKCDRVLVLAGRAPNVEDLSLEKAGIATDRRGFIKADEHSRTSSEGIYAVGDATGWAGRMGNQMYQARVAVQYATGTVTTGDRYYPLCIHSIPEIAMVGMTEQACESHSIPPAIGIARYCDLLQGQISGESDGLVKLVFDRNNRRLLGAHIVGTHASELIHLGVELLRGGATIDKIAKSSFQMPSLSDGYRAAAQDARDRLGR